MRSVHIDTARTWRGGQNQVLLTVTGLAEIGEQAILVAHEAGELRRRASEGLRFVGFAPRSEFDVHAGWQLSRIIGDLKPDVVHAHDPMAVALAAMALQMGIGGAPKPLVVASRRVDFHLKRHAFSAWKYRQVDLFIAASGVIASMLTGDGIPASKIVVVHDGVSLGLVDKTPAVDVHAAAFLPHGAPVIGNVAALAPHKGQKHFVAAAARAVRDVPDARFVIVGEGELRDALDKQIHELGLQRHVTLMGFRPDALGLMKSFDVFVMSSLTEGLGSAVLEAMACRRTVVGTRAGGIPEVVEDGVTGLLVPPHDDAALAAAMVRVLRDRPFADRLAAMGRLRVEHAFSVEHMVAQILDAYERGLAARGRG